MNRLFATFVLAAMAVPAFAATVPKDAADFADKVAVANKFEIDTSQLALKYGNGADVKKFAQQMIDDHTKAGEEFKTAVTAAKIDPPKDGQLSMEAVAKTFRYLDEEEIAKQRRLAKEAADKKAGKK